MESDSDEEDQIKKKKHQSGSVEFLVIQYQVLDDSHPNFLMHHKLGRAMLNDIMWNEKKRIIKGEPIEVMLNDFPTDAIIDNSRIFVLDPNQANQSKKYIFQRFGLFAFSFLKLKS
jgi:hypothetical protein